MGKRKVDLKESFIHLLIKMAFRPINLDQGKTVLLKLGVTTSKTIAKYDALEYANGYVQRADSSTAEVRYVANEAVTTTSSAADIEVIDVRGVRFEADTNADPVIATDRGIFADLTDHDTVNESASSVNVFLIEDVNLPLTDKKVTGYFVSNVS